MSIRKLIPSLLLIIVIFLNACTPQPTASPQTQVPVVDTQVPVEVQGPTEVSIITVHISTVDNGWDKSFIDRVITQPINNPNIGDGKFCHSDVFLKLVQSSTLSDLYFRRSTLI